MRGGQSVQAAAGWRAGWRAEGGLEGVAARAAGSAAWHITPSSLPPSLPPGIFIMFVGWKGMGVVVADKFPNLIRLNTGGCSFT